MSTQLLSGHLPLLLRPEMTNALVVGAGSGATVGALLQHPSIQSVDLVEISSEVVEAAREHFAPFNDRALTDPRTRIVLEDAKTFLKSGDQRYDTIIAEASNPWMAGVAGVFSQEFYQDCRARLSARGMMVQWIQVYETRDETFNMVVATLASVFPHVSIWQTSVGDRMLVASLEKPQIDLEASLARFLVPSVAASLRRISLDRFAAFLSLELIAFGDAEHLPGPGTLRHSDFYPRLEYAAQLGFFLRGRALTHHLASEVRSARPRSLLGEWLPRHPLTVEDCEGLVRFSRAYTIHDSDFLRTVAYRWLELRPGAREALQLLSELAATDIGTDAEYSRIANQSGFRDAIERRDAGLLRQLSGLTILSQRMRTSSVYRPPLPEAEAILRAAIQIDVENQRVHRLHLAELLWNWGRDDEFAALVEAALDPNPALGPIKFQSFLPPARIALARMIDVQLRKKNLPGAFLWAQIAVEQNFLDEEGPEQNLRLSILARRVYQEVNAMKGGPGFVNRSAMTNVIRARP